MVNKKLKNICMFFGLLLGISVTLCDQDVMRNSVMKEMLEENIPFTEDLMREHGLLNRVLLIYEEIIKRMDRDDIQIKALKQAIDIIRDFIEGYHEKLEEDYIFPLFEKNNKEINLVTTLRKQHVKGREITARLEAIVSTHQTLDNKTKKTVANLLKKFINMYRPHEAREDTELFPLVRTLIPEKEFEELGEKFEEIEHELFGEQGFFGVVVRVENIEKSLGIYQLDKFTPQLNAPKKNSSKKNNKNKV